MVSIGIDSVVKIPTWFGPGVGFVVRVEVIAVSWVGVVIGVGVGLLLRLCCVMMVGWGYNFGLDMSHSSFLDHYSHIEVGSVRMVDRIVIGFGLGE